MYVVVYQIEVVVREHVAERDGVVRGWVFRAVYHTLLYRLRVVVVTVSCRVCWCESS